MRLVRQNGAPVVRRGEDQMLTQTMKETYLENGWVVVESVFEPAEAEAIAQLANDYCSRQARHAGLTQVLPSGEILPRKLANPFALDAAFRAFVLDPRLQAELRELLGGEPLLIQDQLFMKPPRHGGAKPYHQDNGYFRCHPDDKVITAWIALDDVDEENGCLRYIDGSHRMQILPHTSIPGAEYDMSPPQESIDLSRESLAPVHKGGVVFHHANTLHTSHRNESDRWRRGYATHWITADVTCDNTTLDHAVYKTELYRATVAAL
jgi:ectoine hydroxylase-related dioxygenase (phytanoyl-CoA dioxygenase family)